MSVIRRLFGKQKAEPPKPTGCHICGAPASYHCDTCGKLVCTIHTATGTASCVQCHERRGR